MISCCTFCPNLKISDSPHLHYETTLQVSNKGGSAESSAELTVEPGKKEKKKKEQEPEKKKEEPAKKTEEVEEEKVKAPKFSSQLEDQKAKEGSEVMFTCKVKGEVEVIWLLNGKEIAKENADYVIAKDGSTYSLTVKKVKVEFVGTYTIRVSIMKYLIVEYKLPLWKRFNSNLRCGKAPTLKIS